MKIAIVVERADGLDVPSSSHRTSQAHDRTQPCMLLPASTWYRDKEGGLVVDYVGIASALKQAMTLHQQRQEQLRRPDIARTALPKFMEAVC